MEENKEVIIDNKYKIQKQIGEGMFGKIFLGKHNYNNEEVAIKIDKSILLKNEARIYRILSNISGIPRLRGFGMIENYNYMVIDKLGKSLENLKKECGGCFDLYLPIIPPYLRL